MADRRSLGIIGWIFGGLTAMVILVGFIVVKGHIDQSKTLRNFNGYSVSSAARVASGVTF
jgi:hypothetical protein